MRVVTTAAMSRRARMPRRPASGASTRGLASALTPVADFVRRGLWRCVPTPSGGTKRIPPPTRRPATALTPMANGSFNLQWQLGGATGNKALTWPAATAPRCEWSRQLAMSRRERRRKPLVIRRLGSATATAPMPAATRVRILASGGESNATAMAVSTPPMDLANASGDGSSCLSTATVPNASGNGSSNAANGSLANASR